MDRISWSRRQLGAAALGLGALGLVPGLGRAAGGVGPRHRVLVSTDIGGTDPDDFQSLVHLLLSADAFDLEGLVASPFGPGRKADILAVIAEYEKDFANLRTHSARYPTPGALRAMTKQGAIDTIGYAGIGTPTEGSKWIVDCARQPDPRPLHLLAWGGIEDLAQALHDAPDILPKLRVYFIGGPNKKWSVNAYQYIAANHPTLWMIEANSTYRGWFVGGNQDGGWGNSEFVTANIAGKGALGAYFASHLGGTIKMGDSPSVGWVMGGDPAQPGTPGWGGRFVRAWDRPFLALDRLPDASDHLEIFGVLEVSLPIGDDIPTNPQATLVVENQQLEGAPDGQGRMRFRFCPRDAKVFRFAIRSNVAAIDGRQAALTAHRPAPDVAQRPSQRWPNWWTDDPDPKFADGAHDGTRTVNRWREAFLGDFARRMDRCTHRAPKRRDRT